ncbi:hypothetical protein Rt10032_c09g3953 [Rhodotorula toruloides]|uniref:Uncharacterized protein n=1 Tax=Rhodotorula toruloides TaxID=5286 RepID=A0A511KJ75_RHOTO|nr:hypothetical protein Rt10032_c09g3953 [Rhodotorula toruloides]
MKPATELTISLSVVFGTIALSLVVAASRFAYRRHKRGRSVPVDPVYEECKVRASGEGVGPAPSPVPERWFGGSWGVTPVAQPGPNGTAQYLSGWFGLDAPSSAGWSRSDADGTFHSSAYGSVNPANPEASTASSSTTSSWIRESHFSRASRASRRAEKEAKRKEKKKPRVSKTNEFGIFEKDAGTKEEADDKGEKEAIILEGDEQADRAGQTVKRS